MRLPAVPPLPVTIGGYRLVRVLGHDVMATSALVHADGDTRVARVFHPGADHAAVEAELAVHDALASCPAEVRQHVAALDDLLTLADGRLALLLAGATGPTLHDLLVARHGLLELGEAVTILAPLVGVIDGAHEVGVTGVPLDPRRIRFAPSGAPVVVSVADAAAGPVLPARLRAREPGYDGDHRAVATLVRVIAAATREPATALLSALAPSARADRATVTALFDLGRPLPVRLDAREVLAGSPLPGAPVGAAEAGDQRADGEASDRATGPAAASVQHAAVAAVASTLDALGIPTRVRDTVVRATAVVLATPRRLGDIVRRFRSRAVSVLAGPEGAPATAGASMEAPLAASRSASARPPAVRRPYAIAGAAGGMALALALVVVSITAAPSGADQSGTSPPPSAALDDRTANPVHPQAEHAAGPRSADEPRLAPLGAALPESATRPEPGEWRAVVAELVRRWAACRSEAARRDSGGSDGCAAAVAHPNSSALALLRDDDARHELLASWLAQQGDVVVVERMGAAVLVDLLDPGSETTAASLLLMRSEAGWRVRDVLD